MMTSKNSKFTGIKKFALLPILAILFVFFTEKADAQTETSAKPGLTSPENEKQDVISFEKKNVTKSEKEIIKFSKRTSDESAFKNDTIKKKQSQDIAVPTTPPPPPTSGKFEQVPAEYPGGPNALRSLVSSKFDTSVFKGDEGLIKTTVYLSIDESGKISNIFAEGDNKRFNAEAVRTITVANEGKVWKPATKDSNPVKTVYKLPLTMKFEGPAKK